MSGWFNRLMSGFTGQDPDLARNTLFPPDDPAQIWRSDNPVGTEATQSVGMPQPTVYAGPIGQFVNPATGQLTVQGQASVDALPGIDTGGIGVAGVITSRLNLERVFSKEGVGMQSLDKHGYAITDPAGEFVGTLDTTWNPVSKELLINDVATEKGANSLGLGAVRQLRESLLGLYPGAKVMVGDRISGAGAGRQATQTIRAR
jgi:hypothetical protein